MGLRVAGRWWGWWLLAPVVGLAVVGILDYVTGWELSFAIMYVAPVAAAAWGAGRWGGLVAAVCGALVWLGVDLAGHEYLHLGIAYWNAGVRLGFFVIIALLVAAQKRSKEGLAAAVEERTGELHRALEELRRETRERLAAEGAVLDAMEREQERIGQDLHDSVQGSLAGAIFMVDSLKRQTGGSTGELGGRFDQLKGVLGDAINQTRALARGLCPVGLKEGGLERALEQLAAATTSVSGVQCVFSGPGEAVPVGEGVATQLYYVCREAVTNAVKHAQAREIVIRLTREEGEVVVRVEDDGVGLAAGQGEGMGLRTMRARAERVGGRVAIGAGSLGGTVVEVRAPVWPVG